MGKFGTLCPRAKCYPTKSIAGRTFRLCGVVIRNNVFAAEDGMYGVVELVGERTSKLINTRRSLAASIGG